MAKGFALKIILTLLAAIIVVFILPALATAGWWALQDRPGTWRAADWTSSGLLPAAGADDRAAIYILGARTGGMKGAFSLHCWVVVKRPGATTYERYDKVGWGNPVRRNAYPADGRWYSNRPFVVHALHGGQAEAALPAVDKAIASYPFAKRGDYRIWPGPNSNSFVAHVVRAAPELGAHMPTNAVGRDYAPGIASLSWEADGSTLHGTLGGLLGFAVGFSSGIELQFLGLVAGIDFARPALLVPAYGRVDLWPTGEAAAAE